MEPRAAIGDFDRATGDYTLYTTSQNPHVIRLLMGAFVLQIPEHKLRVVAPDVGGGFGSKIFHYAEEADGDLGGWQDRPSDQVDGGAQRVLHVRRAWPRPRHATPSWRMDKDGKFLGLQGQHASPTMGAYLSTFAHVRADLSLRDAAGRASTTTPAIYAEVQAVFTNTVPVDAYRGAGRPEATYLLERLVDKAAREMKMDRVEIRRKNLIPANAFPYQTPVALRYDSGDYQSTLEDGAGRIRLCRLRQAAGRRASAKGKLRGIGISTYLEACGIAPSAVAGALGARAGLYECGRGPRPSDRLGDRLHRHAQRTARATRPPSPRSSPTRSASRSENVEIVARRHQPDPVRHGHLRLALAGRRRLGAGQGARQDRHQGQAHRRAPDGGLGRRHRVQGRHLHASSAPTDACRSARSRFTAYVPHNYPITELEPGLEENGVLRPAQLHLPGRLPHLRGRDRSRHRRRRGHRLRGRRRRRHRSSTR